MLPPLSGSLQERPCGSAGNENLAAVRRRWPDVWQRLQRSPLPESWQVSAHTPQSTLLVHGLQLTSAYDRLGEARLQASRLPPDSRNVWVYGMGFGDLITVLLEMRHLARINVVLLHPGIDRLVLQQSGRLDWLRDPRVELLLGSGQRQLQKPWLAMPAYLRLASDDSLVLRDQLVLELNHPYQEEHFLRLQDLFHQRLEENRPFLKSDGDTGILFGSRPEGRFIVVGAGPTLETNLDWLRQNRSDATLITVTRAVKPLLDAGIFPEIALALDHSPFVFDHVRSLPAEPLAAVTLAYAPVVCPELLRFWPGPRLAFYLDEPLYDSLRRQWPRPSLYCSGTVVHTAIDLAVRMGAREVVLLGVDFSYPEGKSHAVGAVAASRIAGESSHRFTTRNGRGRPVPTDANFLGYIRDLEQYLARHPEVRFLKRGKAGADLQGAEWMNEEHDAG